MTDQEALVALNAVPGLGSVRIRKLVEYFGSVSSVLKASAKDLHASKVLPKHVVEKIFEFDRDNFLQSEYNLIRQNADCVITIFEDSYPESLKSIYDPPVVLYVRGKIPQDNGLAVGVVGSRDASVYGLTVAEKFSSQLAEFGFTIVSGLAKGIDSAAHRGSLKTGGSTVAVIGCGLNHIYPQENQNLYEEIWNKGAVISELPMATPPISFNFPARNRIISGLSLAVLVIEASLKSGALITSRFALEQGRDVFAVPGKIDNPNSQGVNRLIKEGAKLVTGFEDIVLELEPQLRRNIKKVEPGLAVFEKRNDLDERESAIVGFLKNEPVYIDDLAVLSKQSLSEVADILLKLELRKIVRQLPGKYFVLKS